MRQEGVMRLATITAGQEAAIRAAFSTYMDADKVVSDTAIRHAKDAAADAMVTAARAACVTAIQIGDAVVVEVRKCAYNDKLTITVSNGPDRMAVIPKDERRDS